MSFPTYHGGTNLLWIGNIPYEAREEDLEQLLSTVGPVASVRISIDKESGQSKGFAFCEYEDPDCCALAVAKLNGTLFGGRTLRLDFSSNDQLKHDWRQHEPVTQFSLSSLLSPNNNVERNHAYKHPRTHDVSFNTSMPSTGHNDINSARISICHFVQSLTAAQLLYILGHLQKLVIASPQSARALLRGNPALCYAVLHAQFICGMVEEPFVAITSENLIRQISKDTERRQAEALQLIYENHARQLEMESEQTRVFTSNKKDTSSSLNSLSGPGINLLTASDTNQQHELCNFSSNNTLQRQNCILPKAFKASPYSTNSHTSVPQQPVIVSPPFCTRVSRSAPGITLKSPSQAPSSLVSYERSAENFTTSKAQIIDELLAHPQLLQQLFSIPTEQENQLTPEERNELYLLREAVRQRQSYTSQKSYPM